MQAMAFDSGKGCATRIALKPGEAASARVAPGQLLACVRGRVWVTFENGGQDHVLDPGDHLPVTARGRMVMEGLMASEVTFFKQQTDADRSFNMKTRSRNDWNPNVNKDSIASAMVLAASLFIVLFATITAAVQNDRQPAEFAAACVAVTAPHAGKQSALEGVFARNVGSTPCYSAKMC